MKALEATTLDLFERIAVRIIVNSEQRTKTFQNVDA